MYQCKYCGGNLLFDIPAQRLKCPYCDSDFDCYEFAEDTNPEEEDSYEVTVFSCPQCGGEIISSDQSVSEFCSYCGSSVVMESRLRREKRPEKIIPFKKTAEDCREAYIRKLKGSFFAPSELKDPKFLEKFRGIYVPYWSYSFRQNGPILLKSKDEYRSGDYDVTDYYNVTGDLDASYSGICYDASSSFDDAISEAIAPFDPKDMKDFVPSYLSGFYGDISDVPADTYMDLANGFANDATLRVIEENPVTGKYPLSSGSSTKSLNSKLNTQVGEPTAAMLPVWFLTWRSRDRVAYMSVNGQTGKVSADIPIDIRKYIAASVLFAVPLYFILNFFLSLRASTSLVIAGIFAFVSGLIYYEEIRRIVKRDTREEDRGYQYARKEQARSEVRRKRQEAAEAGQPGPSDEKISVKEKYSKAYREKVKREKAMLNAASGKKTKKGTEASRTERILTVLMVLSLAPLLLWIIYCFMSDLLSVFSSTTVCLALIPATVFLWYEVYGYSQDTPLSYKAHHEILGSQLAALIAAIICLLRPVSDVIYYIGMIITYIGVFTTLIQIIRRYNLLITRPIPEFHNRGKEQP